MDHAPLGQLTNLRKLALCYELPTDGQLNQVAIDDLARLTNLLRLTVNGFVPRAAEEHQLQQHQQQQSCLPASLTSLIMKGGQQIEQAAAQDTTEQWLQHAAGCSNLQQLQLINLYWGKEDLDLGGISCLKELQVYNSPGREEPALAAIPLPSSITKLTDLEVVWLGTLGSSRLWEYHYWVDSSNMELLMHVSEQCPMLQKLGPLFLEGDSPHVPQPFKHLSHLVSVEFAPLWLDHIRCPSLLNLSLEAGGYVSNEVLQQLAQLTGLTCLQLNTAFVYEEGLEGDDEGWGQLDVLAAGLCNLQRLDLVNHFAEPATPQRKLPPLSMPSLSAFTQLKQLRLACALNPDQPLPEQLTAEDLLLGLSRLTQLEQLELIGYVAVDPSVVCALIGQLPKLLVLEVRRCEHPEVQVAPAGDGAQGFSQGLSTFKKVQGLYRQLRPKLRFTYLA